MGVDLSLAAALERADHHLGIHARSDQQPLPSGQPGSKLLNRSLVLRIPRIEERDQHVGVERYARHSPRSRPT